ncbi:MAG: C40 family peptidase [Candidatus Omnitrophica bacterium]|nr:C40 family peptidase [Candidatus Omnitrophota bacterium]
MGSLAKWYLVPGLLLTGCATAKPLMAVNVPVTDLRARPGTQAQPGLHDPLQETQLLYGEQVRVRKRQDAWTYVEAVEQPEFTHRRRWQGYPGWVPASTLRPADPLAAPTIVVTEKWASTWTDAYIRRPSPWRFPLGTRLQAIEMGEQVWRVELLDGEVVWMPYRAGRELAALRALSPEELRRLIVRNAQLFVGDAYYWGGRSPAAASSPRDPFGPPGPPSEDGVTGVDCSGLINLAYRAAGIDIPRDAHEQFLRARTTAVLHPADLIFLSERGNPAQIVHVMLYAGNGEVIEGPGTGTVVRRISLSERLGDPAEGGMAPGHVVDGQTVSFGAYLP